MFSWQDIWVLHYNDEFIGFYDNFCLCKPWRTGRLKFYSLPQLIFHPKKQYDNCNLHFLASNVGWLMFTQKRCHVSMTYCVLLLLLNWWLLCVFSCYVLTHQMQYSSCVCSSIVWFGLFSFCLLSALVWIILPLLSMHSLWSSTGCFMWKLISAQLLWGHYLVNTTDCSAVLYSGLLYFVWSPPQPRPPPPPPPLSHVGFFFFFFFFFLNKSPAPLCPHVVCFLELLFCEHVLCVAFIFVAVELYTHALF